MTDKLVKELWWEGDDLHTVLLDGTHQVYHNAVIVGLRSEGIPVVELEMKIEESITDGRTDT